MRKVVVLGNGDIPSLGRRVSTVGVLNFEFRILNFKFCTGTFFVFFIFCLRLRGAGERGGKEEGLGRTTVRYGFNLVGVGLFLCGNS